jgi:putative RecB family exonuclease
MTFKQCPQKFKYRYIDGIERDVPQRHLTVGKIVHSLLEHYNLPLSEKIKVLKNDEELRNDEFFTKETIKECIGIYNNFMDSDLGKEIFSRHILVTELGAALDKKLKPDSFLNPDVLFRGKIDMVSVDVKNQMVYITDWKTGKDKSTGIYEQTPDQLILYGTYYFEKMDVPEITLEYVFVEHNTRKTFKMTRDKKEDYKKFLVRSIYNVEKKIKNNEFEANYTPLCNFCEYSDICIPV